MLFLFTATATAADRVVVIPLGGTVGTATAADVVKGKTFSSKAAGKGVIGTLKFRDGAKLYTNTIGMEFSLIPAGTFVMGSPDGTGDTDHPPIQARELGRVWIENQHIVTLTKSYYMQTTEVTQGQWKVVMGNNPSEFSSCGNDCPVEKVSWDDAQNFIDALNAREGRSNCHSTPNTCYAMPTEAQWEYAARGGTITAFYNGPITNTDCNDPNLDAIAWYCGNADEKTHPVAQKAANAFGLYDMSGNVYEWCQDRFDLDNQTYPYNSVTDPVGPVSGRRRIMRGGSFYARAWQERSASRSYDPQDSNSSIDGFRLVLHTGQ